MSTTISNTPIRLKKNNKEMLKVIYNNDAGHGPKASSKTYQRWPKKASTVH